MKKSLISLAVIATLASYAPVVTRARTRDVAYEFRMGAGFPGDINRVHPFQVLPSIMNETTPIRQYGHPAIYDSATNSMRGYTVGDTKVTIAGVLVRPYPVQQQSGGMAASIGAATPPTTAAVIDVLEDGYIMVKCDDFATNPPSRGAVVTVRIAATAGAKVQGGFHAATDAANTLTITNARWNSTADANGVAELRVFAAA